jgi:4-hydroxy-3-methylbut-2-enyl diphosphate reductase
MKVLKSLENGFCFGVTRAYKIALESLESSPLPVAVLGKLAHNRHLIAELKEKGIKGIKREKDVLGGTLIIPSHGVPPEVIQKLAARKINVKNATCPKVYRVINRAFWLKKNGWQVFIFGDRRHSEVLAINAAIKKKGLVFSSVKELKELLKKSSNFSKIAFISQTTQNLEKYQKIEKIGREFSRKQRIPFSFWNTICSATQKRQKAAVIIAKKADLMLIVGSPESANSKRLYQIVKKINPQSYFIDRKEEIEKKWFHNVKTVGIVTGASTPGEVASEIENFIL